MATEPGLWHTRSAAEAAIFQEVVPAQGLSAALFAEQLVGFGENRPLEAKPRSLWLKFLDHFKSESLAGIAAQRTGCRAKRQRMPEP